MLNFQYIGIFSLPLYMILFHLIEQLRGEDDEDDAATDKAFHCFTTTTSQSAGNRVNSLKLKVPPPKKKQA